MLCWCRRVRTGSTSYHLLQDNLWNYLVRGLDYVLPNAYIFCELYILNNIIMVLINLSSQTYAIHYLYLEPFSWDFP